MAKCTHEGLYLGWCPDCDHDAVQDILDGNTSCISSTLSDCAEFLSDINGELALRCEDALALLSRLNHGGAAISAIQDGEVERLRSAVEIAATVFEEYGRLHRAKLHDGTPTMEWLSIHKKAERNEGYAREMRAALKEQE